MLWSIWDQQEGSHISVPLGSGTLTSEVTQFGVITGLCVATLKKQHIQFRVSNISLS